MPAPRLTRSLSGPALLFAGMLVPLITSSAGLTAAETAISGRAVDQPLQTWLEEVSRQTGVRHRVAPSYEDRGVTYRVSGLSDRDFRAAIASLYGDLWSRTRIKDASTWTLTASRARLEKQRKVIEGYEAALVQGIHQAIARTAEHGLGPGHSLGNEADDRFLDQQSRHVARAMKHLSVEQIRGYLGGQSERVQLRDLDEASGQGLRELVAKYAISGDGPQVEQERAEAWVDFYSRSYSLPWTDPPLPMQDVGIRVGHGKNGWHAGFNLVVSPADMLAKLRELLGLIDPPAQSDAERRREGGASLDLIVPDLPILKRPVLHQRGEVLAALAEGTGLRLIADSVIRPEATGGPPRAAPASLIGKRVSEALDQLASDFGLTWRVEKGIYLVRSRIWPVDDLAEPPASRMAHWNRTLDETGRLPLAESVEIALLRPPQQLRLVWRLPEARSARSCWLAFYGSLSEEQRRRAWSEAGLSLWTTDIEARRRFLTTGGDSGFGSGSEARRAIIPGYSVLRVSGGREVAPGRFEEARDAPVEEVVMFRVIPLKDAAGKPQGQGVIRSERLPRRMKAEPGQPKPAPPPALQ